MAKGSIQNSGQTREFFRASLNHGSLKLDFCSADPRSLTELRRIVECLAVTDCDAVEDMTSFELSTVLSEEFVNNKKAMLEIKRLLAMEQRYRIVKEVLPAVEEIDLLAQKKSLRLEQKTIREGVSSLFECVDRSVTRNALVHVKGLLDSQERMIIVDNIHERIPHAQIRAFQTEQDIEGKVLVEVLFFGDFEPQDML